MDDYLSEASLERVVAQVDIAQPNSLVEVWWRGLRAGLVLVLQNVVTWWANSAFGVRAGLVATAGGAGSRASSDGYISGAGSFVATVELHLGAAYSW